MSDFNHHEIPNVFLKHRILIQIIHLWNRCILQRNWHVIHAIKKHVTSDSKISILDAGCGDGQHLFWLMRNYPKHLIHGIDKIENNVNFCNQFYQFHELSVNEKLS